MVTYTLANGGVATLRASGTEPKIKYHLRVIGIRAGSLN
jgi:phosphomannomutase